MQFRRDYRYIAQAALIGFMLIAVDLGFYEALQHMFR